MTDMRTKSGDTMAPELIPARMLNEYAYCARLFYLEWVDSRFEDNDDTVEGRFHHRIADQERGSAPLPPDGELIRAQSVRLASESLGLVARIDVIEGDGDSVRPIDIKRGHPPDIPEKSWEPERIQLCAQGLLLRDAGYSCDTGILYFAGARQRVTVDFDESLMELTRARLAEARHVAELDIVPPPLVDSPKCPRCSLVGICLPDEVNSLTERRKLPPRRLIPRDRDTRPLYVQEQGARVTVDKGRLVVKKHDDVIASNRLIDVSELCLVGNVQVTTQAMRRLFSRELPVTYFTYGGWFSGIAHGLPAKNVQLRRRQVALAGQGGLDIATRMVAGKIANSRTLLRRNSRTDVRTTIQRLGRLRHAAEEAQSTAGLRGIEGAAARSYYQAFHTMIRDDQTRIEFAFDGRNRRPPTDRVNALLSLVYSLLVKDLTVTTFRIGFDPYLGFYHRPRFGRPALALDLAEEFRSIVADSVVIQVINNGEVGPSDFVTRAGGVALTKDGRRAVIRAYERRLEAELTHPWFGYKATYRRLMELQGRLLAAYVVGEVPEYAALTTR